MVFRRWRLLRVPNMQPAQPLPRQLVPARQLVDILTGQNDAQSQTRVPTIELLRDLAHRRHQARRHLQHLPERVERANTRLLRDEEGRLDSSAQPYQPIELVVRPRVDRLQGGIRRPHRQLLGRPQGSPAAHLSAADELANRRRFGRSRRGVY